MITPRAARGPCPSPPATLSFVTRLSTFTPSASVIVAWPGLATFAIAKDAGGAVTLAERVHRGARHRRVVSRGSARRRTRWLIVVPSCGRPAPTSIIATTNTVPGASCLTRGGTRRRARAPGRGPRRHEVGVQHQPPTASREDATVHPAAPDAADPRSRSMLRSTTTISASMPAASAAFQPPSPPSTTTFAASRRHRPSHPRPPCGRRAASRRPAPSARLISTSAPAAAVVRRRLHRLHAMADTSVERNPRELLPPRGRNVNSTWSARNACTPSGLRSSR